VKRRREGSTDQPRPSPRSVERVRTPLSTRLILPVLVSVLFVSIVVVGVFPTRTYLSQKRSIASATRQVQQLQQSNAALRSEARRLGTDAEVEQQARQSYDLVMPGEEVYRILPAPPVPVPVPDVWPFDQLGPRVNQ
jgi:cell division protein FtsB